MPLNFEDLRMQRHVYHFYQYPFNWVDEIPNDTKKNQRIVSWARLQNGITFPLTPTSNGVLVKRLVHGSREEKERDGDLAYWMPEAGNVDICVVLPDDLMVSILARLPFSSYCSVRSVCKRWNAVMPHPDPLIMRTRDPEGTPPLAVMFTVQNCWACYSPVSHQWHHLPVDFGTCSNGRGGNPHLGTIVLGGSNGLLLVAATGADNWIDPSFTMWTVNPINRSERQLVMPKKYKGQPLNFYLRVDNQQSSFKFYQTARYCIGSSLSRMGVIVYDSKSNSWLRFFSHKHSHLIQSIVEFGGRVYTLGIESLNRFPSIEVHWQEPKGVPDVQRRQRFIDLPWLITQTPVFQFFSYGHLFVRDGSLLLAYVVGYKLGHWRSTETGTRVGIWQLVDNYPEGYDWKEVASMPDELNKILWTNLYDYRDPSNSFERYRPQVDVQGDFMWVANPYLQVLDGMENQLDRLWANCGIMCHIPSNSWWKVPNYWDSPNCKLDRSGQDQMLHRFCPTKSTLHEYSSSETIHPKVMVGLPSSKCLPFLFSPCMDLIA